MQYPDEASGIRRRAEAVARAKEALSPDNRDALSTEEIQQILHDLRVHQIELEMQNEELRGAQAELNAERDRYFDLFDLAPVGYCTIGDNGLILEANITVAKLLGVVRGAIVTHPINQFIIKEDQDIFYRHLNILHKTSEPQVCEFRMIRTNKTPFWARVETMLPRKNADGNSACRIVISDITAHKALEEQLRQSQKLEAIGQLAGGVAHDFNNILTAMMMHLSYLQKNKSLDLEALEAVLELMVDAKRSASLTKQLLLFSRRSVMEVKLLDLNDLVTNLLRMVRRLIGEHITVRFEGNEAITLVEADAVMLEQVIVNLSVNARDAMPHGGLLNFKIESVLIDENPASGNIEARPGRFVCLSVADTGVGMDQATLKRIFEPFYTTKDIGKGTGLGLATVHGIVAQHKGWVEVESELGKGSIFKVYLPASRKARNDSPPAEATPVIGGHETILVVEDEEHLRKLVAKGLRLLGYRVLEAGNGQAAIKLWQEYGRQIDLLFSDMRMPEGISGLDLSAIFKKEKPSLKVIVSSGYIMEMTGESGSNAPGVVFFQKPYDFEILSKTIHDCLNPNS